MAPPMLDPTCGSLASVLGVGALMLRLVTRRHVDLHRVCSALCPAAG